MSRLLYRIGRWAATHGKLVLLAWVVVVVLGVSSRIVVGLALAVAVLLDATVIRLILVPSTMVMFNRPTGGCPGGSTGYSPMSTSRARNSSTSENRPVSCCVAATAQAASRETGQGPPPESPTG